ncbi:MAG: type VI secretion protein IcmF/TssM N-terminal domain-containing protein [Phycisphaerae bacterium]|jgi:hypothetical protein
MTSMNSVLQKFFNLPPAVRMALAVAGFGSMASIIYFLLPALRTKQGRIWLLIIAGCALVLVLLIWGLRRLFFGRKSSKLAGALESQGPTRGDIAEQEQVYRTKFQGKLAELKANGLSVYRLPWFVLVGEPGCGKTASLIHSGLDFPLGKDEVPGFGGTRNYNWWFTNDAVILDTAGRIAFQEEGTTDKVEWEFFLKLLKHNRQRCPINGVIIALPADKLLRDTSEERAQKATILRERLRQVHQTLGVRFPTSVLVTKMDLVGGFGEFFEEIRVDLQQRNQMFGWSRPGEFQDPYEPSGFGESFDLVYRRLRDWSMRYLQRKATEEELGLVVTFPEAFRELREPLNDYIGTIFQKSPLLEPPFFRGFYFTSAVQEGAPIFDVFSRGRKGVTIPERPTRAVDSKAFFIHDLYERKVFPESGLVFRSAQHVTLNRRMRRLVWVGTVGVLLAMIALFTFGFFGVGELVNGPKVDCARAVERIEQAAKEPASYAALADNLKLAQQLEQHYRAYDRSFTWLRARALFIGANIDVPRQDVRLVHARFVLDTVLAPVLREAGKRLQSPEELVRGPQSYDRYVAAASVYARWYAALVGTAHVEALTETEAERCGRELGQLLDFLEADGPTREGAVAQLTAALSSLAAPSRAFGPEILAGTLDLKPDDLTAVLTTVVTNLREHWLPLTRLEPAQDPFLSYWLGVTSRIQDLQKVYNETLQLGPRFQDPATYGEAVQRFELLTDGVEFLGDYKSEPPPDTLARAWYNLRVFLVDNEVPQTETKTILRFADQLTAVKGEWDTGFAPLLDALHAASLRENAPPQERVYDAVAEAKNTLARSYQQSWDDIMARLGIPADQELVGYCTGDLGLLKLDEFSDTNRSFNAPKASVQLVSQPFGRNKELRQYLLELRETISAGATGGELGPLTEWPSLLTTGQGGMPRGEMLNNWFTKAQRAGHHPSDETILQTSGLVEQPFWRPAELYSLADATWLGYQRNSIGAVLTRMQQACDGATAADKLPGLARLMPGFDQTVDDLPFRRVELEGAAAEKPAEPATEQPPPAEEEEDEDWRRPRRAPAPAEVTPAAEEPVEPDQERSALVRYHTRDFLADTLRAYYDVHASMAALGQRGEPAIAVLDRAADAYIDHYFLDWNGVYDDYMTLLDEETLRLLRACQQGEYDWPRFQEAISKKGRDIARELGLRFEAMVREVVLFQDALGEGDRGNALFDRVAERLKQLGPQHDLQRRLEDIGRRTRDVRRGDDAERVLGQGYYDAWNTYVKQVKGFGEAPGAKAPPNRAKLRADLEELLRPRRMQLEDFRLTSPLLDIAAYGEVLLANHLDRQLATLFEPVREHYPFVADARDEAPFERLGRLAEGAASPGQLLDLLRQADDFQREHGELLRALHPDSGHNSIRVLDQCAAWVAFLYGADAGRLHNDQPLPLKVKWAISKHEGTASAGSVYTNVTITLPLLTQGGREAAGSIDSDVRSGFGESLPPKAIDALASKTEFDYRWNLFVEQSYAAPGLRVWEKNPNVRATYPDELRSQWQLPGSAVSLLLLIGADPANRINGEQWTIPVLLEAADEKIGFDFAIQFERTFPGPCAPMADPGAPPKMTAADRYLQVEPGRRP